MTVKKGGLDLGLGQELGKRVLGSGDKGDLGELGEPGRGVLGPPKPLGWELGPLGLPHQTCGFLCHWLLPKDSSLPSPHPPGQVCLPDPCPPGLTGTVHPAASKFMNTALGLGLGGHRSAPSLRPVGQAVPTPPQLRAKQLPSSARQVPNTEPTPRFPLLRVCLPCPAVIRTNHQPPAN